MFFDAGEQEDGRLSTKGAAFEGAGVFGGFRRLLVARCGESPTASTQEPKRTAAPGPVNAEFVAPT
jgi:hypothetical protein